MTQAERTKKPGRAKREEESIRLAQENTVPRTAGAATVSELADSYKFVFGVYNDSKTSLQAISQAKITSKEMFLETSMQYAKTAKELQQYAQALSGLVSQLLKLDDAELLTYGISKDELKQLEKELKKLLSYNLSDLKVLQTSFQTDFPDYAWRVSFVPPNGSIGSHVHTVTQVDERTKQVVGKEQSYEVYFLDESDKEIFRLKIPAPADAAGASSIYGKADLGNGVVVLVSESIEAKKLIVEVNGKRQEFPANAQELKTLENTFAFMAPLKLLEYFEKQSLGTQSWFIYRSVRSDVDDALNNPQNGYFTDLENMCKKHGIIK